MIVNDSSHRDLAPERQERLRGMIRQRGAVRVEELCEETGVSPATIRRDLEALEETGKIKRVHGGAVNVVGRLDEPRFDDKTSIALEEKRAIAREAAKQISAGETIYLDGGSTLLELARCIRDMADITVVTNSLRASAELSSGGPRLILLGGELRRRSQTMVGTLTRGTLERIHVDKAFMGTMGLAIDEGLTTTDPNEAFTKELVMSRADEVILLADSTKAGEVCFARAGGIREIKTLITDNGLDEEFERRLKRLSIEVVKVPTAKE